MVSHIKMDSGDYNYQYIWGFLYGNTPAVYEFSERMWTRLGPSRTLLWSANHDFTFYRGGNWEVACRDCHLHRFGAGTRALWGTLSADFSSPPQLLCTSCISRSFTQSCATSWLPTRGAERLLFPKLVCQMSWNSNFSMVLLWMYVPSSLIVNGDPHSRGTVPLDLVWTRGYLMA